MTNDKLKDPLYLNVSYALFDLSFFSLRAFSIISSCSNRCNEAVFKICARRNCIPIMQKVILKLRCLLM